MKKVYVDGNNQAELICSNCGFNKKIDAKNFKNTQKKFKAKCKCGETIRFNLDYRNKYRKDDMLPGEYNIQGKKGEMIVRDLSMSGIKFESIMLPPFSSDDTLEVKFKLNNLSRKEIRKKVKVVWINARLVGAKFIERNLYEKDLGFYLNF